MLSPFLLFHKYNQCIDYTLLLFFFIWYISFHICVHTIWNCMHPFINLIHWYKLYGWQTVNIIMNNSMISNKIFYPNMIVLLSNSCLRNESCNDTTIYNIYQNYFCIIPDSKSTINIIHCCINWSFPLCASLFFFALNETHDVSYTYHLFLAIIYCKSIDVFLHNNKH